MKVLVVEDDNETAAYVANGLKELGHTVDVAVDGREGLLLAAGVPYELMIIDRMLPEIDGLSIVRRIRIAGVETPVLFLTALGGVDDRVSGLDAGADDYLPKPFAFSELLARINALARRPPMASVVTTLQVGDLHQPFQGVLAQPSRGALPASARVRLEALPAVPAPPVAGVRRHRNDRSRRRPPPRYACTGR